MQGYPLLRARTSVAPCGDHGTAGPRSAVEGASPLHGGREDTVTGDSSAILCGLVDRRQLVVGIYTDGRWVEHSTVTGRMCRRTGNGPAELETRWRLVARVCPAARCPRGIGGRRR